MKRILVTGATGLIGSQIVKALLCKNRLKNSNIKVIALARNEEKVKKAYPAYFDTYEHMDELTVYLSSIDNLYCVGRNGQHRYNNLDHSMCTSFETVKNILSGTSDKSNIWSVNTEAGYHESK